MVALKEDMDIVAFRYFCGGKVNVVIRSVGLILHFSVRPGETHERLPWFFWFRRLRILAVGSSNCGKRQRVESSRSGSALSGPRDI
mmetsp:Transcript_24914/g.72965  ORF Transcript_24914/g.72965 Transcript_24914/m.72965 type:complete len:86 (+) Transcript_24914:283-540(+)